ncbi:MAG: sensor histidine kinase [Oscillospiraceae bacterium]|nr:sensor histidine kinase [Oscillospiraceae bacterium]
MRQSVKQYFRSIRFRIWISFVAFTLGTMVILYITLSVITPALYSFIKTNECTDAAQAIKNMVCEKQWSARDRESVDRLNRLIRGLAVRHQFDIIVNLPETSYNLREERSGNGEPLIGQINDNIKNSLLKSENGTIITRTKAEEGQSGIILATYAEAEDSVRAYIFIYSYSEPIGTTLNIVNSLFFVSSNVILIGACVISIMISSHIANPLVKISRNADQLINGNFSMELKGNEYDEVATLTENLNAASGEIAKTETLRKDIMANVSHDLRTPLTMIKAYAEMIRDLSGDNPEKREKHLQVIIDETDRLTSLVSDILDLSKLESGVSTLNCSVFDFSGHLEDLMSRFSMLDDMKDYQVLPEIEPGIMINADRQKLEQVVYNLVNNAINYIGDDREVKVRLFRKEGGVARFEVADRGVGIPEEQLPYIWDRYYKVDRSENHKRTVKGTGLGLSIVKGILINHGFEYGCDSVVDKGSCFWFEFAVG